MKIKKEKIFVKKNCISPFNKNNKSLSKFFNFPQRK